MTIYEESISFILILDEQNEFSTQFKRSTVEFMGMRVSYPQYVRLRAIQVKSSS